MAASASSPTNPIVFFDVSIASRAVGRIKMELFANKLPRTAENFRQFCTGEFTVDKKPVGFKGCTFHRVVRDFIIQGGDFVNGNGTGNMSIYGPSFADESFELDHEYTGLLSMANAGPNQNGCQFFITCAPCPWLNGKNVVFGHVVEGMKVIREIEQVPVTSANKPKVPVVIEECGQFS